MNLKRDASVGLVMVALGIGPLNSALAQESYSRGSGISQGSYFGIFGGISKAASSAQRAIDQSFQNALATNGATAVSQDSSLDNANAWGVQVGYRWNSYVAAEVGYVDLGSGTYNSNVGISVGGGPVTTQHAKGKFTSSGVTAAMVGMFPVGEQFDIYARGGIYFSDTSTHVSGAGIRAPGLSGGDEDTFFGVGGAWHINRYYSLRFEYNRFINVGKASTTGEADVDLFTVDVLFR